MSDYGNEDLIVELRTEIESLQERLDEADERIAAATYLIARFMDESDPMVRVKAREFLKVADSASACDHPEGDVTVENGREVAKCRKCGAIVFDRAAFQPTDAV